MCDSEFWKDIKEDSKRRKIKNLNDFDLVDWYKINNHSYRKTMNNIKFTYYPSTKCLVVKNKSYKGIHKNNLNKYIVELSK